MQGNKKVNDKTVRLTQPQQIQSGGFLGLQIPHEAPYVTLC